jgi:hypothetical protein
LIAEPLAAPDRGGHGHSEFTLAEPRPVSQMFDGDGSSVSEELRFV